MNRMIPAHAMDGPTCCVRRVLSTRAGWEGCMSYYIP